MCKIGAEMIATKSNETDDDDRLRVYLGGHYPSGTSTQSIFHYG